MSNRTVCFRVSVLIVLMLFSSTVFAGVILSCEDFDTCGGRSSWGDALLGVLFLFGGVLYWFTLAVSRKSTRLWYTGIIGGSGLLLINQRKLSSQIIGWVLLISVFLVWYWQHDSKDVASDKSDTPSNSNPATLQNASPFSDENPQSHQYKDSSTLKADESANEPYFSDVPWAKDKFQAKQYRKLIANGYTFSREDSKVVATSPKGKRQVIYTSFQLDDLVDAVEKSRCTKTSGAVAQPQPAVAMAGNMELARKISTRRIVVLTVRQWEDGPWLARAYKAHDAALAYIKNVPQLPLYVTDNQLINAAVAYGESLSNLLYDSGVEPLDSESGLDRLAIAETLVARLKKNFSDR